MSDLRTTMKKLFPVGTKIVISLGKDDDFVTSLYTDKGQCLASVTGCSTPFSAIEILASKVSRNK